MSKARTLSGWFRTRAAGALVVAAVAASGCAHGRATKPKEAPVAAPFRIGQGDVLEISVYRDADLTRTVPVRPDGRITLPIAGEIMAAGRTPEEVRTEIAAKLKTFVNDPTVITLIVREVNSARFFVVGEVVHPGAFPLRSEINALQALALAGGLGEFSDRDELTVVRGDTGEQETIALDDLHSGRKLGIRAGDTLVVP